MSLTQEDLDTVIASQTNEDLVALRDQLAGQLIAAMLGNNKDEEGVGTYMRTPGQIVKEAYAIATEMLTIRKTL